MLRRKERELTGQVVTLVYHALPNIVNDPNSDKSRNHNKIMSEVADYRSADLIGALTGEAGRLPFPEIVSKSCSCRMTAYLG